MADAPDFFDPEVPFEWETPNGHDADFNEALKQGLRRASVHWLRAGYEILAGVGAFLEELKPQDEPSGDQSTERIDLE